MNIESVKIKDTDKIICKLLEKNARISLAEIAETVGLSIPSVSDHIKKMEEQNIITGYHAAINPLALGLEITAFISVLVENSTHYQTLISQCKKLPEVLECHAIVGQASHILKVRVDSLQTLERLLSKIQQCNGVVTTTTNIVLSTHYESTFLVP